MAVVVPPSVPATSSLYVGDLHHDVSDGELFDAFSEFKTLASVRICRDSTTGRSLCYGYVNFISPQDAVRAIEVKNHSPLHGKLIRVTWSLRNPDIRKSGIGNVFVKNLNESVDTLKLQELFQKFGNILSCKVEMFEDGKSKGYGFVQFESDESANSAIENLNGTTFEGKQMYVGKFMKKSDRASTLPDAKYTNLYIKNLDTDITEETLTEKFSTYGKIASLVISKDDNGASRGFGFVNFENPDDAKQALEAMNGLQIGSKILYVARAQKKAEREQILRRQFEDKRKEQILKFQGSNVYVKNIDDDVTDDELREHFSQCGSITSAKLMRDDKGISKGFGFVCYSTPEEAFKAVGTFHGFMFHRKPLYVAIAQRKEDRIAQLQIQYAQRMSGVLAGPPNGVMPAGGYPSMYYAAPPGVIPQVGPRPGLIYQPLGLRPGWRPNGFAPPTRPVFQPNMHMPLMSNPPRQLRPSRGRMNGTQVSYDQSQPLTSPKDPNTPRKYTPNTRARESTKGTGEGSEVLSSMLAAASPDQQKQMLGERLYPLVNQHKPESAAKITGMLLEMDNAELLLLLESPESLVAKVEEAVQVLKLSKAKVSNQDAIHNSNYLSTEVAVN